MVFLVGEVGVWLELNETSNELSLDIVRGNRSLLFNINWLSALEVHLQMHHMIKVFKKYPEVSRTNLVHSKAPKTKIRIT